MEQKSEQKSEQQKSEKPEQKPEPQQLWLVSLASMLSRRGVG